ncbi:hypothetical protein, partial [Klebsiella pneumoniae]|uniref:hypothetical protein n=1 Tax=Klebsiella pneumoniae TaxID=573 RepID=UPI001BDFC273
MLKEEIELSAGQQRELAQEVRSTRDDCKRKESDNKNLKVDIEKLRTEITRRTKHETALQAELKQA